MYIALCELLHSTSVVFLCVCMSIHTPTKMSCVPISSFHHSESPYRYLDAADYPAMVFYAVMLVMYLFLAVVWGNLYCCYYKDLIRLQVWVCGCVDVYACVGEVGLCMCAFWNPNVQMGVSMYFCLYMQQVQLHQCYVYVANYCHPVMSSTSCSSSEHPSFWCMLWSLVHSHSTCAQYSY